MPALVDEALFEAARAQLAENRQRKRIGVVGATVLLQGLLVCARCGYAYHGIASHWEKRRPYRSYPMFGVKSPSPPASARESALFYRSFATGDTPSARKV